MGTPDFRKIRMATAAVPGGPRRNDVRLEDQENINLFSRLNLLSKELKAKIEGLKRSIEDSEEAGNEIMLMDDDTVPFVIGECFVRLSQEEAEKRLEDLSEAAKEECEGYEKRLREVTREMGRLKESLYERFGNSIHLEDD